MLHGSCKLYHTISIIPVFVSYMLSWFESSWRNSHDPPTSSSKIQKKYFFFCREWVGVSEVPDGPRQSYLPLTLIWHVMLDLTRPRSKEIWPHGEVILQKNDCSTDPPKTAWAEEGKRMISANWSFNVQICSKMNRVLKYLVNRLYLHVCVQQNCGIFKYGLFMCLYWIGL